MLDAYVIDEIRRREREKSRDDRPSLEFPLPLNPPRGSDHSQPDDRDDSHRGVVIIDYG